MSAETQQMCLLFAEEKRKVVQDIIGNMSNNTPDTENRNVFGIFILTKYIQCVKMYIPNYESEVAK